MRIIQIGRFDGTQANPIGARMPRRGRSGSDTSPADEITTAAEREEEETRLGIKKVSTSGPSCVYGLLHVKYASRAGRRRSTGLPPQLGGPLMSPYSACGVRVGLTD